MTASSVAATTATPSRVHHPGISLAIILTAQLMIGIDTAIVTIALPDIQHGLHVSATGLAWIQNSYLLALGGLLLLGGRAGDILGRRRVFVAGVALFTAASLAGGLATAGWFLMAARAAQGVGAAITGPSTLALIATNFEGQARTRALSLFSAVTGAGAAIGMVAGGMLTDWASWPWVFFVNVPVGIALVLLAPRFLAETERRPGRFDLTGALTSTLGLTALVYGFIRAGSDGWRDGLTLGAFVAAAGLMSLFLMIERRAGQPVMPLRLFADRDRAGSFGTMILLVAAMFGAFYFLTQYLQEVLGYGPLQAGFAFLPLVLMQFATVRTVPRLLPRLGARTTAAIGTTLVTVAMVWLTQISAGTGYVTGLLGPFMLLGLGGGMSIMPLNLTVLAGVAPREAGAVSGLAQTMTWGGGSLGSAVLVTVFGTAVRHADHTAGASHVLVSGMTAAFTAAAVFAVCSLAVVLLVIRPKRAESNV